MSIDARRAAPAAVTPVTPAGPAVQISDVSKTFGRGDTALLALDQVSLSVAPGEFVCLIGASGCGKSTLLSLVAGLDTPTVGGGRPPAGSGSSLMFQESALFPWLTAARNVELPLRANGVPRAERRDRVAELLDLVHLGAFARQAAAPAVRRHAAAGRAGPGAGSGRGRCC